ncbi:hypothetical protein E2562_027599 [Oryza meyeriana var. granulata]|uniref:Uncharacterized protein n=1 Tax=Oryza meyeriana var. granulata TaxID=110450 RepID=A0A6G1DP65_9ORYZ|nr:hypothetical protein E2562_027599 [Oryza meyeriana var. granulata]
MPLHRRLAALEDCPHPRPHFCPELLCGLVGGNRIAVQEQMHSRMSREIAQTRVGINNTGFEGLIFGCLHLGMWAAACDWMVAVRPSYIEASSSGDFRGNDGSCICQRRLERTHKL